MNENNKYQNKRQNKRRKIIYLIKNNQINKRKLNYNEIILFYNSIKQNNLSKFGIIKLSELELEIIFNKNILEVSNTLEHDTNNIVQDLSLEKNNDIELDLSLENNLNNNLYNDKITLMKYAIEKKRNKIIGSLIRGGYDPSVYPNIKNKRSAYISILLSSFPIGYTIWMIYYIYEMIEESLKNLQINNSNNHEYCQVCDNNDFEDNNNDNDNNNNDNDNEFKVEIKNFLLTWKPCNHKVCYKCSWEHLCTPLKQSNYSLRCPQCFIRCDGGYDEYYLIDQTKIISNISSIEYENLTFHQLFPIERSTYSYNLWLNLPSELDTIKMKENKKRPEFIVGPIYEVSKYLIGTTKEQRLLEFHRGIVTNHIYRLYWLFCCGVNINGQNKYGQTPLMISIISNHLESLKFLLWCGADFTITDNIQSNILSIAFYHKKENIYNYLKQHLPIEILQSYHNYITSLNFLQNITFNDNYNPNIVTLIPIDDIESIDGRGSCYIDNCFSSSFLNYLDECLLNCPLDLNDSNDLADYDYGNNNSGKINSNGNEKKCSTRYYMYDSNYIIRNHISKILEKLQNIYLNESNKFNENNISEEQEINNHKQQKHSIFCQNILPTMKYLHYSSPEISLQSHIDLSKEDPYLNITSTHTLILYLTTCENGGETVLLNHLNESTINIPIKPVRGRLLIFPHHCPHKGETTIHFPKTLLRCEAY